MSDDFSTRGIERQRRRMTRDLGEKERLAQALREATETERPSNRGPWCTCGHVFRSHQQDPVDPWVAQRCKTCGCAGFENRDEARMQSHDEEES